MDIIASSDFHGRLPEITKQFDLFLVAGDICPARNHSVIVQKRWIMTEFVDWVKSLPYRYDWSKVILVPGNHDFALERMSGQEILEFESACEGRVKVLRHDEYEFKYPLNDSTEVLKIFGTPYCSIFFHWAFMINDDALEKKFGQIPEGIDILISHDSPTTNRLGVISEGPYKNETTGNKILAKHIDRVKPKLFVSGHFHSGNHVFENVNGVLMGNVSYVNEDYEPSNPVAEIFYDEDEKTFSMKTD